MICYFDKSSFDKFYINKNNYQMIIKKLMILPFMGSLSLESKNRLNSYNTSQLLFIHREWNFSQKPVCLAYLHSETVFPNTLLHI